jgi:hypothetical protein
MLDSKKFNEKLLEMKKVRFINAVQRACKANGFAMPNINFEGCQCETEEELAHYHPDTHTICISRTQLMRQNFDDLEETAIHEVVQKVHQGHETDFRDKCICTKINVWKPRSEIKFPSKSSRKNKPNRKYCNYFYCDRQTKAGRCPYCCGYFCNQHLEAKLAGMPNFVDTSIRNKTHIQEYRRDDGHPCVPYYDVWKAKTEEENERYRKSLSDLLRADSPKKKREYFEDEEDYPNEENSIFDKIKNTIKGIGAKLGII